jgi:hypothetical protein
MGPKSIALYLDRKGWTARVIHDNFVATLGEEAVTYSTATRYLPEPQIDPAIATLPPDQFRVTSPRLGQSDEATLRALRKLSFFSV